MFDYLMIHHNTVSNHTPSCVCLTRKFACSWDRRQWDCVKAIQKCVLKKVSKWFQMYLSAFLFIISNLNLKFGSPAPASPIRIRYFNHRIRSCYGPFKHRICQSCKRKADGLPGYPVLKHGLLEHPPFWSVMFENKPFMVDFPTHVGFEGKQFLVNKVQASTRTSRELTSVSWTV